MFAQAKQLWELAAKRGGVAHAGDLIGGHAGGIREESQMHQLIHGSHVFARHLGIRFQLKPFAVGIGQARLGNVHPLLRPFHAAFHLPYRIEVFVKLLLIVLTEIPSNAGGILQHEIKQAAAALEPTRLTRRVGIARAEEAVKNLLRLV